jgi:RNA recognition motif-containing protein
MSRLYVGNLPQDAREDDLRRLFSDKAQVRELTMKNGFAFIVRW